MVLLCAGRHRVAAEVAAMIRQQKKTVRFGFTRYEAEGLHDALRRHAPTVAPTCRGKQ
jgi:hypothetical protein